MMNIQRIFRDIKLSRLFLELPLLSAKISLAMIIATFRMIVPRAMKRLLGETVLITGAGHGVGRELAIQLSSMGCIIVCWDIHIDKNRSTMREVSKNGGEVYGFVVDVSKRLEVRETVRLMRKLGVPDVTILINNAAVLYHKPFLSCDTDDVERTFSVNVLSHFWTIEAFLPTMLQRGSGHIVAMSSMCGIYGVSQKVAYCSSKFAVRGLMEALHEEIRCNERRADIRFTTIYPFYIDTGLARDPEYRFPSIFGAVTAEHAAQEVIKAIRRNYIEHTIPRCLLSLNAINRIVPESVMRLILDFLANVDRKRQERSVMSL
ncbi:short-chain dehydrogenase/reductase family 16C member 6 [Harpegnathos saltator]|uniref:Short-chain dehydrogenase/reductase 3 n=1 Tax=Harpegnathos saltator TaxID=610380 RepID=E2C8Y9_HARSA|nr:short-chain dehydrogenase/reductase family 16C member 6 [Harpegnathos saltator]EFN75607.1 Epidermal retinal dehydrogenase 2 [Harpegnathos saltator]